MWPASATLSRLLCRLDFTYKKQLMAAECARADIREQRRVWTGQRQPRMRAQPHRLVFLDETYVNSKMTRLRGRSRRGQRLRAAAPFGPWTTHTFIAGLRCHELRAPRIIDGPITRSAFDTYIETQQCGAVRRCDGAREPGQAGTRHPAGALDLGHNVACPKWRPRSVGVGLTHLHERSLILPGRVLDCGA